MVFLDPIVLTQPHWDLYQGRGKQPRGLVEPLSEDSESISIPRWLFQRILERLPRTEFKTASEYVTYVLAQVTAEKEKQPEMTPQDEEKVKDKLKALGYL